ncbi:MAG: molybdopterin molybdotransferase MoeA [candidate division Zixibacteria bacterium]|nr:molybdopterin molybdotransferase MoeA [candidate division Zixibacteria bacterium]MDH3936783.1 molybdopterin molybdotransferase MoeA [candidate division Zixibacteria bacterium]MDH4032430.1 molybdopterin molybdotransferase MoeA [candidate division Zixibacteria bacterium]
MISFAQATDLISENVSARKSVKCSIRDVVGHVLAEDIESGIDVVSFRNAAMDGFAVRSNWLSACSESKPLTLPYKDTAFAGDARKAEYADGVAVKIMTGAPVPEGYDSVVRFEDTKYDNCHVSFFIPVGSRTNVREPGEDIERGQKLFASGDRLGQLDIGILASIGLAELSVHERPSVHIASTGNELVAPGTALKPGQLYNSNLYTLEPMVSPFSRAVQLDATVGDSEEQLRRLFESTADVIITSGGVSAGERDLVIAAAEAAGFQSLLHKVRIKPGKPFYFAKRNHQFLFGLPGNPLSTAVTCAVLVLPALKKMCGRSDFAINPVPARLSPNSVRKSGRMLIWPGMFKMDSGEIIAEFSNKRSSAALSALLDTDGLIIQSDVDDIESPKIEVIPWNQILSG